MNIPCIIQTAIKQILLKKPSEDRRINTFLKVGIHFCIAALISTFEKNNLNKTIINSIWLV